MSHKGFQPRSAKVLAELPRNEMLAEIAQGMSHLATHVADLAGGATTLHEAGSPVAARALEAISTEEAGKYLILLDAARCARGPEVRRKRQLGRFSSHLAKGIYAETAWYRPHDLAEIERGIRRLRLAAYLDGPSGVDWIFRNEVESRREESLYVDFVQTDDGETFWQSPGIYGDSGFVTTPSAVRLVGALHRAGASTAAGLTLVDEIWHDFVPTSSTHWQEVKERTYRTLKAWDAAGLAAEASTEDAQQILESWTFPLHSLELKRKVPVDLDELRAQQESAGWDW